MSLIARELHEVWDALRASKGRRYESLSVVRIRRLRGIWDIRIPFEYPVSVLAGPNGCGKSTVLFACACAYQVPGGGGRDFTPANLFPNFVSRERSVESDARQQTAIEFKYLHHGDDLSMTWGRGGSWKRSFPGRAGRGQPERPVYLRTLANLTNRSEVRSLRQLGRKPFEAQTLDPELLTFAHRILPWRYRNLTLVSGSTSDLLLADVEGLEETHYSEFHMSSGERAILRISKDIARLQDALILIDEVDTGLHPYTQQQAMLELQRSALRQNLQIVVTSHSSVVLDSVPPEARIFLDRAHDTGQVRLAPRYRDIFQRALYGQSRDRLSVLCEDAVAEGLIRGVLDVLNLETGLHYEDVVIGRNTGRDEFVGHLRTLGKFERLSEFLFVLDGDSRGLESTLKQVGVEYGGAQVLFLPGDGPPERWLWDTLGDKTEDYAGALGRSGADLRRSMRDLEQLLGGAVQQRDGAKAAVRELARELGRTPPELARSVGQRAAERRAMPEFLAELKEQIARWRRLQP